MSYALIMASEKVKVTVNDKIGAQGILKQYIKNSLQALSSLAIISLKKMENYTIHNIYINITKYREK